MRTRACGGFMSFTPPPPRGLILIHTCQTVLNPGASRSRVPSHHADKRFFVKMMKMVIVKMLKMVIVMMVHILPKLCCVCMFHPIMVSMQEWMKLTTS